MFKNCVKLDLEKFINTSRMLNNQFYIKLFRKCGTMCKLASYMILNLKLLSVQEEMHIKKQNNVWFCLLVCYVSPL